LKDSEGKKKLNESEKQIFLNEREEHNYLKVNPDKEVMKHESVKSAKTVKNQWNTNLDGAIQRIPAENDLFHGKLELDLRVTELLQKCEGLWICKACGKKSKQKGHMRDHVETHIQGAYTCHVCKFNSKNRKALKVHIRYKHSESLATCSLCGKSGISKVAYKDHKLTCRYEINHT